MPQQNDPWTIRAVVVIVGAIIVVGIVGVVLLAYQGKPVPDILAAIIPTGLAGLVGILASIKVNPTPVDPPGPAPAPVP